MFIAEGAYTMGVGRETTAPASAFQTSPRAYTMGVGRETTAASFAG